MFVKARRIGDTFCSQVLSGKYCFSTAHHTSTKSFHKRPLPANLIALSSSDGKRLFREALTLGGMECFFPLAEQFVTQSEPSYCSLSSLAMVLNALNYDPKKIWKGAWRWVSEEMLHCETEAICGHSLEKVQKFGLNFSEFESLARCHGVNIVSKRVCHFRSESCGETGFREFSNLVEKISSTDQAKSFIVTNFSRKYLGQTGDGHFSPIGGFHKKSGLVLVLDVARFKYPPYWVKLEDLWDSMAVVDKATGLTRGYFVISTWDSPQKLSAPDSSISSCPPLIRTWESLQKESLANPCTHSNSRSVSCDHIK